MEIKLTARQSDQQYGCFYSLQVSVT